VLSALRREDAYGYVLTQTLMGTLEISESTLYPVLRRLQKDALLSIYDRPHMGRNRRYYRITDKGLRQADIYRAGWREYKSRVDSLILSDGDVGVREANGAGGPIGGNVQAAGNRAMNDAGDVGAHENEERSRS
jgi:PadR family transcriptional regulator PadR